MRKLLLVTAFTVSAIVAFATNRYWIGNIDNNWGNANNWSTVPGGGGSTGVPGAGDQAFFTNGGNVDCTINIAASVSSIIVESTYANTLTISSTTSASQFTVSGGTVTLGNVQLNIEQLSISGGTLNISGSNSLNVANQGLGGFAPYNVAMTGGVLNLNSSNNNGDLKVTNNITLTSNAAINLSNRGDITCDNLTLGGTSTVSVTTGSTVANIDVTTDLTISGGTLDHSTVGNGTVNVGGNCTLNSGSIKTSVLNTRPITVTGNVDILGGTLTFNSASFVLSGNFTKEDAATIVNTGTGGLTLSGTVAQTVDGNTNGITIGNLVLNNATGFSLNGDLTVTSSLTMTSGDFDLNGNNFTLGTSSSNPGTLNYTSGNLVDALTITRYFSTSTITLGNVAGKFPIAITDNGTVEERSLFVGIGTTLTTGGALTLTHTPIDGGRTVIAAGDNFNGNPIVIRNNGSWVLENAGITSAASNFSMRINAFGLDDSEADGKSGLITDVADLALVLTDGAINGTPTNSGTTAAPVLDVTGLTLAELTSTYFVGSNNAANALPVELMDFTADKIGKSEVQLKWLVSSETNNRGFEVERSYNGVSFEVIHFEEGRINASSDKLYSFTDGNVDFTQMTIYYRLKQIDVNNEFQHSDVVKVGMDPTHLSLYVFPNPAENVLSFENAGFDFVQMIDSKGAVIGQWNVSNHDNNIDLTKINKGIYFIKAFNTIGDKMATNTVVVR